MSWILFALLAPVFYSVSAVIDNYLSDKLFRKTTSLIFYSFIFQLAILPIVFAIQRPTVPSLSLLPYFLIAGLCDVLYLYPYYKALQNDDTAVVNSLWAICRVFVPIGAFFFIGEALAPIHYLGFLLVITSSVLLSHNGGRGVKFNRSLLYMVVACAIVSAEIVIYKHLLSNATWSTSYIGATLAGFLLMLPMLLIRKWRNGVTSQWQTFRTNFHWLGFEGLSTGAAAMSWTYAASLAPVSLVVGVGAVQPFIVLIFAVVFSGLFPKFFKEKISARQIVKKMALFAVTAIGVLLIAK